MYINIKFHKQVTIHERDTTETVIILRIFTHIHYVTKYNAFHVKTNGIPKTKA